MRKNREGGIFRQLQTAPNCPLRQLFNFSHRFNEEISAGKEGKMKKSLLIIATLLLGPAVSQATLITTAPSDGTTTVLNTVTGTWSAAPSVVAGGFTVSAPSGSDVWFGDSKFGLSENGFWEDFAWVGGYCWTGACAATIDLGGLYSQVGGFMNYSASDDKGAPTFGSDGGSPIIRAIAADGTTVLESYDLATAAPIATPGGVNAGEFRGISTGVANIAYLQIQGSYLIMHDLTLGRATTVPEPGTLLLLGSGMIGLVAARKFGYKYL